MQVVLPTDDTIHRSFFSTLARFSALVVCAAAILLGCSVLVLNTAPSSFPVGTRIAIPEGSTLTSISRILAEAQVVRSAFLFRTLVISYNKENALHAGEYLFPEPLSTLGVVRVLISQEVQIPPQKVTIPEGSTLADFDKIISDALPRIESGDISKAAEGKEGALFPDTYFMEESSTAEEVVALLRETFTTRLAPLEESIAASGFTQEEVIILASLVEREANDEESMKIVSGILQNRLAMNMPLQVDATFDYVYDKESSELTLDDLQSNHPFNTYRNRGLPPSPIASPSMRAIEAVLFPIDTAYVYYLTDDEGIFHYAETFDEHKVHKARYLRN